MQFIFWPCHNPNSSYCCFCLFLGDLQNQYCSLFFIQLQINVCILAVFFCKNQTLPHTPSGMYFLPLSGNLNSFIHSLFIFILNFHDFYQSFYQQFIRRLHLIFIYYIYTSHTYT